MRPFRQSITMDALDVNGVSEVSAAPRAIIRFLDGVLSTGFDANGLYTIDTPGSASTLAMDGALASSTTFTRLSPPRQVVIFSSDNADESAINFTFTGTDINDDPLVEVVAGPVGDGVEKFSYSTNNFKTITNIASSAGTNGDITIGAQGIVTNDVPRHMGATSGGASNWSGKTITFTGTDRTGAALTESIAGPDSSTTSTTKNFLTVTSVTIDATVGGDLSIGTVGALESAWIPLERNITSVSIGNIVSSGATITYTTQYTLNDIRADDFVEDDADPFNAAGLTSKTASADGTLVSPVIAVRAKVSGFTSGTLDMTVIPSVN